MTTTHTKGRLWRDPCLHMAALVLALIGVKLLSLETVSRTYLDCQWCLTPKSITHETEFVLLLLAVHLLSCVSRLRFWRVVLRAAVVLAVLITAVDLMVAREFWVRFTASDFFKFAGEFRALKGYLQQSLSDPWVLMGVILVALLVITVFVRYLKENAPSLPPVFLYLLIALGVVGCELVETNEYHDTFLRNSVEVFFSQQTNNTPYSKDFVKTIGALPGAEQRCNKASSARTDVEAVKKPLHKSHFRHRL